MPIDRDLRVSRTVVIPASELVEVASRSTGPGGQHVNKTSTRIALRWCLDTSAAVSERQRARIRKQLGKRLTRGGEIVLYSGKHRSQARNREAVRERLIEVLTAALKIQPPRVDTKPSRSSKMRVRATKERRSTVKKTRSRVRSDGGD